MKNCLVVIFVTLINVCHAQSRDEQEIRELLSEQTLAWNDGNIDRFMKTYWQSDSLMFIGKNGITYGWANTRDNYKKNYPDRNAMGKLSFNIVMIRRLSPDYFQVIGKWNLQRQVGDLSGHFTLLLKMISGKWLIVSDHSS